MQFATACYTWNTSARRWGAGARQQKTATDTLLAVSSEYATRTRYDGDDDDVDETQDDDNNHDKNARLPAVKYTLALALAVSVAAQDPAQTFC